MPSEMEPADWLENMGEPIVIGPDDRLTHPGDPDYDENVNRLYKERVVEHLRRFPRPVREAALKRMEELAARLDEDREAVDIGMSAADALAEVRAEREEHLLDIVRRDEGPT